MEFKLLSAWCVASASTGYVCVCDSLGSVVGSEEAADFGWNHACDGAFILMQRYAKQVCQITPLLRCDQVYLRIALKWFQVCLADLNVFVCVCLFLLPPPVANSVFLPFLIFMTVICTHTWLLYISHIHYILTHTFGWCVCVLTSLCTWSHVRCYAPHVFLTWSHIPLDGGAGGLTSFMLRSTCLLYMAWHTANIFHAIAPHVSNMFSC